MKKEWNYNKLIDDDKVNQIADKYSINKLLAKILVSRNITEDSKIEKFLAPKRNDFNDPFLFPDMEKAVDYLRKKGLSTAAKKSSRVAAEGIAFAKTNEDNVTIP